MGWLKPAVNVGNAGITTVLTAAVLQENIDYPGSVFLYLARLHEQNPTLAALVAKELKRTG